jgi:arylsulfatase
MPTRRKFIAQSTATALSATRGVQASGQAPAPHTRPNILWICTDQQRWDTIHALGNPYIRTPNIDRLVETGVAFTHAHCQSTICTPSRASFMTGMYPGTVHGCFNGNEQWEHAAPLITKILADTGYDCGLAGKLHLAAAQGRIEPRPDDGYRVFDWSHHPSDNWPEGHAYINWLEEQGHTYKALKEQYGYIPADLHQTTWCTDRTIDFIRETRTGPWLFSLNCYDPHPPFDPPQEYVDRFNPNDLPGPLFRESDLNVQQQLESVQFNTRARRYDADEAKLHQAQYWAQIELIDENVGRILQALEDTGQRENTLIIFTSDHGEMAGDHGLRKKGCRFFEGLVRVPLIFSWPGMVKENLHSSALVELLDIVPTLLDCAGLKTPETMQGKSLLPLLTGSVAPDFHKEYVRCEFYFKSYATMIRNKQYKLVNYHGLQYGELFDMQDDPGEFRNLWDMKEYREIRTELMIRNFDALAFAVDKGSPQIAAW